MPSRSFFSAILCAIEHIAPLAAAVGALLATLLLANQEDRQQVVHFLSAMRYGLWGILVAAVLWIARETRQRWAIKQHAKHLEGELIALYAAKDSSDDPETFCKRLASELALSWHHKEDWKFRYRLMLLVLFAVAFTASFKFADPELSKWSSTALTVGMPFSAVLFAWSIGVYQAYYNGWHALNNLKYEVHKGAQFVELHKKLNVALTAQEAAFTSAFAVLSKLLGDRK